MFEVVNVVKALNSQDKHRLFPHVLLILGKMRKVFKGDDTSSQADFWLF